MLRCSMLCACQLLARGKPISLVVHRQWRAALMLTKLQVVAWQHPQKCATVLEQLSQMITSTHTTRHGDKRMDVCWVLKFGDDCFGMHCAAGQYQHVSEVCSILSIVQKLAPRHAA
eukprot:363897-Chlamydomonas_euryale.AAC.19